MISTHATSSSCYRKSGLTLLEVLAALAILATILAGVLLARGKLQRQHLAAQQRLRAVAVADQLLSDWWPGGNVPLEAEGIVPNNSEFRWRTQIVKQTDEPVVGNIIRLQMLSDQESQILSELELWLPASLAEEAKPAGGEQ